MYRNLLTIILFMLAMMASAQHHPQFDAAYPDVHDPVMAQGEDGRYYIFSTGMGVNVMSSADMKTWKQEAPVFTVPLPKGFKTPKGFKVPEGNTPLPSWTTDSVKGFHGHIWAPDISKHNDRWYLYYSCSTFGKNGSAIGLVTNRTLDPNSPDFKWEDQGCVIVSHRHVDDYNCIDPNLALFSVNNAQYALYQARKHEPILFFGSFWDGIQMVPLAADMKTPTAKPKTVARRCSPTKDKSPAAPYLEVVNGDTVEAGENAIEAPFVIKHGDYYYLFVSWDYCCRGKKSTYKTVYGRSTDVSGPDLDKDGKDMAQGGGTFLVGPGKKFFGVGHCSAYELDGQWYFLSHAYDISKKGQSKLYLRKLEFTEDKWIKLTK